MKNLIKQFLCTHKNIATITETNIESPMLIIKTLIQCSQCRKTFIQHPDQLCCYIYHIQHEIMQEQVIHHYKTGKSSKHLC